MKAYRVAPDSKTWRARRRLADCLNGYQNPVPEDVLDKQMRAGCSRGDRSWAFVPESLRHLATSDRAN